MEIWSIEENGKLACLLNADSSQDADEKMIELNKKYPNRIFIITPTLVARRVINGEVVCKDVYS